jgi:predicted ATP-grasp superfamily ATP-dependent carboligase
VAGNAPVSVHPDTGQDIQGFQIPHWDKVLNMASQCYEAVSLGYLGVDIVLDRDHGPLILELNARPGLNIQIANRTGLKHRLLKIDALGREESSPERRIEWSCKEFRVSGEP